MEKLSDSFLWLLPLLSAFMLWLGFPGGGESWPLLFLAYLPLLYLAYRSSPKKSFYVGLLGGMCHFLLLLYWIVIVLGRYGGLPWFFSIPALFLLSLYMSLFMACFTMISSLLLKRYTAFVAMWAIPAVWVGGDWLRSFLFSGFPWMDPGYALWKIPILIQTADLFGHYGISFLVMLINCMFFFLFLIKTKKGQKIKLSVPVVLLLCVAVFYGRYRMQYLEQSIAGGEKAVIGIVQGNIDQSKKWTPNLQQDTVAMYTSTSVTLTQNSPVPQLVVWPETALPFFPTRSPLMEPLRKMVAENNITLLSGSPWFVVKNPETRDIDFYNSAFLLHPSTEYGDMYYKSHLVPFGEYVPLKKFLPFLAPLVEAVGDFSTGAVTKPLIAGQIRAGVLICFESIFPDIARRWVDVGANVLINLTNDAWYGKSSAPYHSLAMTVFRAVETRRSLVRAANTGVSGFIDPLGRVLASSEIFTSWSKSMEVSLMDEITFHTRYGYLFAPFCFLLTLILLVLAKTGKFKQHYRS